MQQPRLALFPSRPLAVANHAKINSKDRDSEYVTAIITEEFLKVIHTLGRVLNNLLANCEFKELVTIKIQDFGT